MKKIKYLFILIVFCIAETSCHRENVFPQNTSISGQLTDSCTGKGLQGSVTLNKDDYHPSVLNAQLKLINTDENGNYEIKFYAEKNKEYRVKADPSYNGSGTASYQLKESFDHIKRGDHITYSPKFSPETWLNIDYKDVTPYDPPTDSLYCVVTDAGLHHTNFAFTAHGDWNYAEGIHLYDCFPLKVYLNWDVTKNHLTTHHSDSVICNFPATTNYNLNY